MRSTRLYAIIAYSAQKSSLHFLVVESRERFLLLSTAGYYTITSTDEDVGAYYAMDAMMRS